VSVDALRLKPQSNMTDTGRLGYATGESGFILAPLPEYFIIKGVVAEQPIALRYGIAMKEVCYMDIF